VEKRKPARDRIFHRPYQTQVTLLDQVEQRKSPVDVATCNLHHQAQVAFDHALPAGHAPAERRARQRLFFLGGKQLGAADFAEVDTGDVTMVQPLAFGPGGIAPFELQPCLCPALFQRFPVQLVLVFSGHTCPFQNWFVTSPNKVEFPPVPQPGSVPTTGSTSKLSQMGRKCHNP